MFSEIMAQKEKPYELRKHCVSILKDIGSMEYSRDLLELCDYEIREEIREIGPNPIFDQMFNRLADWKEWN
jgi:hypothetical protein